MKQSSSEQLALRAIALVMAAGVGVWYGSQRSSPQWLVEELPDSVRGQAGLGTLVDQVDEENVRARRRATRLAPGERLDPNTADSDELQRLPRVGPALAARIVAHREAHGAFRSLADLEAVPGIGPGVLASLEPHLTLPAASAALPLGGSIAPPTSSETGRTTASASGGPLEINRATAEELVRLPGVGPVIAERLVEWRLQNGPFRSAEDLQKVPGIGPSKAKQIAPHVRFAP